MFIGYNSNITPTLRGCSMVQIILTPELEEAISRQARARKTTPEELALDSLRERFLPSPEITPPKEGATMADFFEGLIGVVDSRELVPGGAQMSENTGRKFAEGLMRKHRAGK